MMHCENIYYKMNIETNSHHRSKKSIRWNGFIVEWIYSRLLLQSLRLELLRLELLRLERLESLRLERLKLLRLERLDFPPRGDFEPNVFAASAYTPDRS